MVSSSVYTDEFQASLDYVLAIDPALKSIVDCSTFHPFLAPRPPNPSSFQYLVRSILSQQVSGAAGQAIYQKFLKLTDTPTGDFPTPEKVLLFSVEELRTAGLSMRKGEYVLGLARAYVNGTLSDEILSNSDNNVVVERIVEMYGLGPWTAEMFLIFYLHRSDIFSTGDIGVQRGFRRYITERPQLAKDFKSFGQLNSPQNSKKVPKLTKADLKRMEAVASRFSPHRTAFQMILWKLSDINMNTLESREMVAEKDREKEVKSVKVRGVEKTPGKVTKEPRKLKAVVTSKNSIIKEL